MFFTWNEIICHTYSKVFHILFIYTKTLLISNEIVQNFVLKKCHAQQGVFALYVSLNFGT